MLLFSGCKGLTPHAFFLSDTFVSIACGVHTYRKASFDAARKRRRDAGRLCGIDAHDIIAFVALCPECR